MTEFFAYYRCFRGYGYSRLVAARNALRKVFA